MASRPMTIAAAGKGNHATRAMNDTIRQLKATNEGLRRKVAVLELIVTLQKHMMRRDV